jgi:hypothetical protein
MALAAQHASSPKIDSIHVVFCSTMPQGFVEVWREDGTLLTCEPEAAPSQPPWVSSLIEAMSVSGAMLLAAVALLVWMRMAVALRPRWRREKELNEHRKKGVPCGGPATIVVTDIQAYSGATACCGLRVVTRA